MKCFYKGHIDSLDSHDVFVFGSNLQGFHGAGSAGFASFGVPGNRWREFGYAAKPDGWRGKWNVKGRVEGLQHGTDGWSYALPTVTHPGAKRSRTPAQIKTSIKKFYDTAARNPTWRFLVAASAAGKTMNGYSGIELAIMFCSYLIPENVVFEQNFMNLTTN